MRGKIMRAPLVAVLALGIASCGGSGSLSRADLVKQARAICTERRTGIEALRRRYPRDLARLIVAAVPLMERGTSKLADLNPPKEMEAEYHRFVTDQRAEIAEIRRAIAAFKAHRRSPPGPSTGVTQRRTDLKHKLGLDTCM